MSCSLPPMFFPSMWKKAKPRDLASFCTAFGSAWSGRNHTPPRGDSSKVSSASGGMVRLLFADAAEVGVVVVRVVHLASLPRDDAPGATRALARGLHGELTIVAP